MSAAVLPAEPTELAAGRSRWTGLLRAELHRFRARRFLRVLLLLGVVGWLASIAIGLATHGHPSAADLTAAQQRIDQIVSDSNEGYRQCLADASRPPGVPVEQVCGEPLQARDLDLGDFVSSPPFSFARSARSGAMGFGAAAAVLAFLAGATWIGAEWSTRSLVALLFWEPRRLRVMATKAGLLLVAVAGFGALAQAAWLADAGLLQALVGDDAGIPDGFWGSLLPLQGRAVLITALAGLGGFALATLIRNTAAALGVGFVYFAVVETAVRSLVPALDPWLVTNNVLGLLLPGGLQLMLRDGIGPDGQPAFREYVLGNLQSGIFLSCVVVAVAALGTIVFARRDLT